MKLESWQSAEEKARWKCVRTDDYTDVPGEIIAADEATGEASVSISKPDGTSETQARAFGPYGMRIVRRRR